MILQVILLLLEAFGIGALRSDNGGGMDWINCTYTPVTLSFTLNTLLHYSATTSTFGPRHATRSARAGGICRRR